MAWRRTVTLLCSWLAVAARSEIAAPTAASALAKVPATSVIGLADQRSELPCDMTPPPGDTVLIVLWYRDRSEAPIYSYDLRNRVERRRHWSNQTVLSGRAEFVASRHPSVLVLLPTRRVDAALYRCRVDFQYARTRHALVNLTVIVPPESVVISDSGGAVSDTVVGDLVEGQPLTLICRVKGGYPRPRVVWKVGSVVVARASRVNGDQVVSQYSIGSLSRDDLHKTLTCLASNTNLTAPATASVMIDMDFAPLSVSILGEEETFSAGRRYQLVCQCVGSRPPPIVTWSLDGIRLGSDVDTKTMHKGNVTMATLLFTPKPSHDRKVLLCRCQNPKVTAPALEDKINLVVHFLPRVAITLSRLFDPGDIKEGGDVYFECSIRANPAVYKMQWRHNNRVLQHSTHRGVIIINGSLALQHVNRTDNGVYTCVGFNEEGNAESSPITLDVKYAPVCRPGLQRIYGVAKRERINILCDVEANPGGVKFWWRFNNTAEVKELDRQMTNSSGARSVLRYRPNTEMDYGTMFCFASNDVGQIASPCVFHVIAAGPPDPLHNCSIHNRTTSVLMVTCVEGFDGGVVQSFLLNVYADENRLVYSRAADTPVWWVDGLASGRQFRVQAVAQNSKGRSSPAILFGITREAPQLQQEAPQDFTIAEMLPEPAPVSPLLAVLAGVLGSAVLLAAAAAGVTCLACRRRQQQRPPAVKQAATELGSEADDDDDKGPDVVAGAEMDASYEVYQIQRSTATLPPMADKSGNYSTSRGGDIPMRMLNHIAPMNTQAESFPTLPVEPPPPPRHSAPPAVYATVDRRRAHGAVSHLHAGVHHSDTRTPLVAAGDGDSSL